MRILGIKSLQVDRGWSFPNVKPKDASYATHGYHRYPAKFIPQLVESLINEYSRRGDVVLDPMGGCGTTLVEAKLNGRNSVGIDVNRVAVLIARAKTQVIKKKLLEERNQVLLKKVSRRKPSRNYHASAHPRLQYWFKPDQYNRLKVLYGCIEEEPNAKIRLLYQCCFSNVLKNCSIWYAKSIKPQRDLNKQEEVPSQAFERHLNFMTRKNEEFGSLLKSRAVKNATCRMMKGDARCMILPDNFSDLIITSPPYVTSYEYADLHQLSSLWFGFTDDIRKMKRDFIGTLSRTAICDEVVSDLAKRILEKVDAKSKFLGKHIANYYGDLDRFYGEARRVLKKGSRLCLILGDTEYMGIHIPNTAVSIELLEQAGFSIERIIKRQLSSKIFTPYRDSAGRFTDSKHGHKRKIYQYEYIVVARKLSKEKMKNGSGVFSRKLPPT